ncbi:50S ribosomal protein L22 [Candidatus Uhrbacteria bacterium]|nr:50S ribosomal protein L22 [Candidatus Uhrbacteria bacterium]
MDIRAYNRNVRQSARKVRLIADLVRGMDSPQALDQLRLHTRIARIPIEKVLRSALANAEHNFHINSEDTFVKTITVDQGTPLKRWRPRAFGRAAPIAKHSCHITLILGEKPGARKSAPKPVAQETVIQDSGLAASQDVQPFTDVSVHQTSSGTLEHKSEAFDARRAGRHELDQKNNKETKKQKGFLKKVFNRKAG